MLVAAPGTKVAAAAPVEPVEPAAAELAAAPPKPVTGGAEDAAADPVAEAVVDMELDVALPLNGD